VGEDRRHYVLVGAFVVAMTAALLLWIGLISGRTGATDPYYTVYENVLGLEPGARILYEGHPVGVIHDIRPVERDGRRVFRVDLRVREGWPIPVDSVAAVKAPGLLSSVVIDIEGGRAHETLPPGSEIPSREAADVFAAVGDVAASVQRLVDEELRPIVAEAGRTTPEILANLERLTAALDEAARQLAAALAPENVERVSSILGHLEGSTARLEPLLDDVAHVESEIDEITERVAALLDASEGELGQALVHLDRSLEAVARHVDAIAANLETASRDLSEFGDQIRRDPSVLLRGREQTP
jgi:phospholipid/cholesterol/gamma-HCH transport system substrate-binding protein